MGLHDDAEMLAAAQAQSVLDEREIARLKAEMTAAEQLIAEQARTVHLQGETLDRVRALAREHNHPERMTYALAAQILEIVLVNDTRLDPDAG